MPVLGSVTQKQITPIFFPKATFQLVVGQGRREFSLEQGDEDVPPVLLQKVDQDRIKSGERVIADGATLCNSPQQLWGEPAL